ncbi:MAG: signal peptidase II [Ruminococcus sp.]|nr:signal peptidase II [Ruminococcus sp.]
MAIFYLAIALLIVIIDQVIKYFVVAYLEPVGSVTAIPHILDLVYQENNSGAMGIFRSFSFDMRWVLVILTSVVMAVLVVMLIKNAENSKLFSIALTLIIGGGIGNLIDRLFRGGAVVDYLLLSFFPYNCNFADYCITAGTIILIIYLLFYSDLKSDIKFKNKKNS